MSLARAARVAMAQVSARSGARGMGSAAGAGGITYEGLTIQPPSFAHRAMAEIMGGMMWSWLFIRMYEDGEGLLFGHTEHLDHDLHEMQHGSHH